MVNIYTNKRTRFVAGMIALAYILIQLFQYIVFRNMPEIHSLAEELQQGADLLNIWRGVLLLLSFFGLIYVFLIICMHNLDYDFTWSVFAFIGLLTFCSIEICLRSVEIFYIQIHLPRIFHQLSNAVQQEKILDTFSSFQSIQYALYFPLLFSQMLASIAISITFNTTHRINYLIIIAFGINAIRLIGRILGMYMNISLLNSFSGSLYLPFVASIFGLISIWLFSIKNEIISGDAQSDA